jgi:HEAT repeat protein
VRKLGDLQTRAATARRLGEAKDRRAVRYLTAYCSDENPAVRLNSIWALGEIGDARAALEITMRITDPEPRIHLVIASALAKLVSETAPTETVINGLEECLKNEDTKVKLEAAKGLAKVKNEPGIKCLLMLLGHQDPATRKAAEDSLRSVGEAMIPALTQALGHARANEETLRHVKLVALFKRKDTTPALLHTLQVACLDTPDQEKFKTPVRQACLDALADLGPEIVTIVDKEIVQGRCGLALKVAGAELLKRFPAQAVEPISRRVIARQIFPEELELKLWVDTLGELGDPAAALALSSALTKPVRNAEPYKKAVAEAVRKIEAKTGKKLDLPPPPPAE